MQFVPVSVRMNIERLDFGELKQLIGPSIKFLEREVSGQIALEGRFGQMDVRNVTLHTGSSVVRIAGTVRTSILRRIWTWILPASRIALIPLIFFI